MSSTVKSIPVHKCTGKRGDEPCSNTDHEDMMSSRRTFRMLRKDLGRAPKPSEVLEQALCSECVERINGSRKKRGQGPIPFEGLQKALDKAREAKKARERRREEKISDDTSSGSTSGGSSQPKVEDDSDDETYCCSRCHRTKKARFIKCAPYWELGDELKRLPTIAELEETAVCVRCLVKGDEHDEARVWISRQVAQVNAKRDELAVRRQKKRENDRKERQLERVAPAGFSCMTSNSRRGSKSRASKRKGRVKLDGVGKAKANIRSKLQQGRSEAAEVVLKQSRHDFPNEDWDAILVKIKDDLKKNKSAETSKKSKKGKKKGKGGDEAKGGKKSRKKAA